MVAQTNTTTTLDAEVKFRLKPEHKAALEKIAAEQEASLGNIVRQAVREFIAKDKKRGVRK